MDVRLSAEHHALRDAVAQVVDRLGPRAVGALDDGERARRLDAAVTTTGWRELRAATDEGPPWASAVEVAIIAEGLGRGLADTPFLGPTLAADLRRRAGAPAAGEAETVVLDAGLDGPVRTDGEVPSDAVAVDGRSATGALVLVPTAAGHSLARVGVVAGPPGADLTRPAAIVAAGRAATTVGGRALEEDDLAAWTALGLATACADLVGTMDGALALAVTYAGDRSQYGRPIGTFQAVQHLLADAAVAVEGSRSVALHAAWAVDARPPPDALVAASVAKAYCGRAARTVCETAIQVHGGMGNTWECLAHVHLRRALLSTDVLGGTGPCLARIAAHHGIGT